MYISMYTWTVKDLKRGQPVARIVRVRCARKSTRVRLPLLKGTGQPGPACPNTETPYELVFD
jgi:hypothetical protein